MNQWPVCVSAAVPSSSRGPASCVVRAAGGLLEALQCEAALKLVNFPTTNQPYLRVSQ